MSKPIHVVMIDTGINHAHLFFDKYKSIVRGFALKFDSSTKKILLLKDEFDTVGHGTAVSSVLLKNAKNIRLTSIKLESEEDTPSESLMIEALKHIYSEIDCDIIHLSLGLTSCYEYRLLYSICEKLHSKGVIIVASYENDGAITHPASFDNIIGVDLSDKHMKSFEYEFIENCIVNIRVSAYHQLLPTIGIDKYERVIGSSFLSPLITARIANLMSNGVREYKSILLSLKDNATFHTIHDIPKYKKYSLNPSNVIIFPINKEMYPLLKYKDDLSFNVVGLYDTRLSGLIGKHVSSVFQNIQDIDIPIKNIDSLDWNNNFDTIILGHLNKINLIEKRDYISEMICLAKTFNKKIYAFDDLKNILNRDNANIFHPHIDESYCEYTYNKLFKFACPIIAILGTSKKQGKFSVQLEMKRRLIADDYQVGFLGSEPMSSLFGADEMFPFGYDSAVDMDYGKSILYLNQALMRIEKKGVDAIIIGSQSQTLHPCWGNIGYYPVIQHLLLLASEPDVYILCINADDDKKYIHRTLNYIESMTCALPIGIVISPFLKHNSDYLNEFNEELLNREYNEQLKNEIYNQFGIPGYSLIWPDDMDDLYARLICVMSEQE